MAFSNVGQRFPCPVCGVPQEVRSSKKDKPYIACNSCGVLVFVRRRDSVREFRKLLEVAVLQGTFKRMRATIRRYRLRCKARRTELVSSQSCWRSFCDGSLSGVRCSKSDCGTVNEGESDRMRITVLGALTLVAIKAVSRWSNATNVRERWSEVIPKWAGHLCGAREDIGKRGFLHGILPQRSRQFTLAASVGSTTTT